LTMPRRWRWIAGEPCLLRRRAHAVGTGHPPMPLVGGIGVGADVLAAALSGSRTPRRHDRFCYPAGQPSPADPCEKCHDEPRQLSDRNAWPTLVGGRPGNLACAPVAP